MQRNTRYGSQKNKDITKIQRVIRTFRLTFARNREIYEPLYRVTGGGSFEASGGV